MKKLFSLAIAVMATAMAFAASTASGDFDCGQMVRLQVTPHEGYEFVEWQNGAGVAVSTANPYDVEATAAATYTAILRLMTYDITYQKGSAAGAIGNTVIDTKTHFTPIVLRDDVAGGFSRAGYHQDGWSENADGSTNDHALGESYATEAAITLYPYWVLNTYTISYAPGAGATGTVASTIKDHGTPVNLSSDVFTKTGYDQDGWSVSEGGGIAYAMGGQYTADADATLYPHWNIHTYTITYNPGSLGSGTVEDTYQTYGEGAPLSSNVFTRADGYTQVGWALSDGGAQAYALGATYTGNADLELFPVWEINKYHVRFLNWDGSVLQDLQGATAVNHGDVPAFTGATPTRAEDAQYTYAFAGWDPTISAATADIDYTAQYDATLRQYSIRFENFDNSLLQESDVDYGTMPAAPVATRTEVGHTYTFNGWTTNDLDNYASDALPLVTGPATYKATYIDALNPHVLSVIAGEGGTVSGNGTFAYGTDHTISATPNACYVFDHWEKDGMNVSTDVNLVVTIPDEDVTYTAVFRKIQYTIQAVAEGGNGDVTVTPVGAMP